MIENGRVNLCVLENFSQFVEDLYITATTKTPRLHDPHISSPVQLGLRVFLIQLPHFLLTNPIYLFPHFHLLLFLIQVPILRELWKLLLNFLIPLLLLNKRLEAVSDLSLPPPQAVPLACAEAEHAPVAFAVVVDDVIGVL